MGVQKHYKKRFTKKSCRKVFTKNSTKNPKPTFSQFFCYPVFGRFSMRGVQKHDKKNIEKINPTIVPFRTLTHPPTTGVPDFFFCRPLAPPPTPAARRSEPGNQLVAGISAGLRGCCVQHVLVFGAL
jgi:hypothetical protein